MDRYKRHVQLCRICTDLGQVYNWSFHAADRLAEKIAATGKEVEDLKVRELLRLIREI